MQLTAPIAVYALRLRRCTQACALTAALVAASGAFAQSVHRPLGLQNGDEYRLLFVTHGARNALSSDIAQYNAFVTAEANLPNSLVRGLSTQWFAIASTSAVDAIDNTDTDPSPPGNTGVPIYLVNGGLRLANNYDEVWGERSSVGESYLLSPPNLTQYGVTPIEQANNVWTGSNHLGMAGGLGGPLGSATPSIGVSRSPNGRWINNNFSVQASSARSFYAISPIIIAVPEPSSHSQVLWLVASAGVALFGSRQATELAR